MASKEQHRTDREERDEMAWYITETVESTKARGLDHALALKSRHWSGPYKTREAAQRELDAVKRDGTGTKGLYVVEDPPAA